MATIEQILLSKGSDVIGATPTTTVREAVTRMIEANVGSLVIEVEEEVLGIFTERDLLVRVVGEGRDPAGTHVSEVMSAPVYACGSGDDVDDVVADMTRRHIRHLAVEDNGEIVGVISLRDVFATRWTETLQG